MQSDLHRLGADRTRTSCRLRRVLLQEFHKSIPATIPTGLVLFALAAYARNTIEFGEEAGPRTLRAHPQVDDREPRLRKRGAVIVQRRPPGCDERWQ